MPLKSRKRSNSGHRADLGIYVRSSWEANFARFLNWQKMEWSYESKTFWFENIKRGTRSYTPDFYVKDKKKGWFYVEVKGWMDQKSRTKLARMAKYYPDVRIEIIGRDFFNDCERKGLCRLIPYWECKHNLPDST